MGCKTGLVQMPLSHKSRAKLGNSDRVHGRRALRWCRGGAYTVVPTGGLSWGVPLAAGPVPSERGAAALGRAETRGCQAVETASRPRDAAGDRLGAGWSWSSLEEAPQSLIFIPEGTPGGAGSAAAAPKGVCVGQCWLQQPQCWMLQMRRAVMCDPGVAACMLGSSAQVAQNPKAQPAAPLFLCQPAPPTLEPAVPQFRGDVLPALKPTAPRP